MKKVCLREEAQKVLKRDGSLINLLKLDNKHYLKNEKAEKVKIKGKELPLTNEVESDDACDRKAKKKMAKSINFDAIDLDVKSENVLAERTKTRERLIILDDELRMYNYDKGYFIKCSPQDMYRSIYSSLKKEEKMLIPPATIRATYEIILMDPSLIVHPEKIDNKKKVNLNNGVIDLDNPTVLQPHSYKYFFTDYINAEFEEEPENENFKYFLNYISGGDEQVKRLLAEWTGYLISYMTNAKKAAIIVGPSDSGKSLFIRLISEIIGLQNISNIELQKLNDKTYTAQLFEKKVNFCNDLPSQPLKDFGVFKMLTSELDMTVSKKLYHDPKSQPCTTKLVFASNHLPVLQPNSGEDLTAFFNRIVIIPFLNSVPEGKKDKDLLQKLIKEKNAILKWAIKGVCRYVRNNYTFSYCKKSQDALEKYKMQYNLHKEFIDKHLSFNTNKYCFTKDLKKCFAKFCKNANVKSLASYEKVLMETLKQDLRISYKRINRDQDNRWGFMGVEIIPED